MIDAPTQSNLHKTQSASDLCAENANESTVPEYPNLKIRVPEYPIVKISSPTTFRDLLSIYPDGTVTGDIQNVSEAGRLFVEHIRFMLPQPQVDVLKAARELRAAIREAGVKRNTPRLYAAVMAFDAALSALEQSK